MKLKYLSSPKNGIPISDSLGRQRVCGIVTDDNDMFFLFVDCFNNSMYIERVINKFEIDIFKSSNLAVISNEQFDTYYSFFVSKGLLEIDKQKDVLSKDQVSEIIYDSR